MIDFFKRYISRLSYYSKVILTLVVLVPLLAVFFAQNQNYSVYATLAAISLFNFIFWLFALFAIEKIIRKSTNFLSDDVAKHEAGTSIKNYIFKVGEKNEKIITWIIVVIVILLLVGFCTPDEQPPFYTPTTE